MTIANGDKMQADSHEHGYSMICHSWRVCSVAGFRSSDTVNIIKRKDWIVNGGHTTGPCMAAIGIVTHRNAENVSQVVLPFPQTTFTGVS